MFDMTIEQTKNELLFKWDDFLYNKDSGLLKDPYVIWVNVGWIFAAVAIFTALMFMVMGFYHLHHCVGILDIVNGLGSAQQTPEIIEYAPRYPNKTWY
jgi:hypothetical protein